MTPRVMNTWHNIRTSFWFVPAVMATAAAALAFTAVRVDRQFAATLGNVGWLWSGSPDGARDVLSVIASSMITVAGVTFSVTMVALTMAASQFGPRLLRNFIGDTGNQVVLGTYVSTFLYCLLVLRAVSTTGEAIFIPHLGATLALLFATLAVAVLIYFIHHVASSLQIETLVASIADDLLMGIDNLFPEDLGQQLPSGSEQVEGSGPDLEQPAWPVRATEGGYVQAIDDDALMVLANEEDLVVRLLVRPGNFISISMAAMEVWPAERGNDELASRLNRMVSLGRHRTMTQDVEFPAQQIVSIALRALSPAINDPFTAMICIDWLGSALLRLARRRIPSSQRADAEGRLRVIAATTDFAGLTDLIYNPIRRAALQHPAILLRLLEKLHALALHAIRTRDRQTISEHAQRIRASAHELKLDPRELAHIDEQCRRIEDALQGRSTWPGEDGEPKSESA